MKKLISKWRAEADKAESNLGSIIAAVPRAEHIVLARTLRRCARQLEKVKP